MTSDMTPLTGDDAPQAAAVMLEAFAEADRRAGRVPEEITQERHARLIARLTRFTETDPDGCWSAREDGAVIGFGVSLRRDGLWGLALLFVHPDRQSDGLGGRLLAATRTNADGADVEMIMASDDPRAIRAYAGLGLRLHPAVQATGAVDRSALPSGLGVRDGTAEDLDLVDAVDVGLRGSSRASDVEGILSGGYELLVVDRSGRCGYAVHHNGNVVLLGAEDVETARALLWESLGRATEDVEHYGWTVTQGWAVDVALQAKLKVQPGGPMFLRGRPAFPEAYLPSGVYF